VQTQKGPLIIILQTLTTTPINLSSLQLECYENKI